MVDSHLNRDSSFSYVCNRCQCCCVNRQIAVNPYEIARLAKNKAVSTTVLMKRFVDKTTMTLQRQIDGKCTFLSAQGCTVYSDRPLACRLYPLARNITSAGKETFEELPPDPHTTGAYGKTGPLRNFIAAQDVERHIEMVDRYFQFYGGVLQLLKERATISESIRDMVLEHLPVQYQFRSNSTRAAIIAPTFDVDQFLADYCSTHGIAIPDDIEQKVELHLKTLEEWADELSKT